jgi:hypothetical protein
VGGNTTSFGAGANRDIWVVKVDSAGTTALWQKTYGGRDVDRAADVIETSDGDLFPGTLLTIFKDEGGQITLNWGASFLPASTVRTYYLVVPFNGHVEGSYGLGAGRTERGHSVWPCEPQQNISVCP